MPVFHHQSLKAAFVAFAFILDIMAATTDGRFFVKLFFVSCQPGGPFELPLQIPELFGSKCPF